MSIFVECDLGGTNIKAGVVDLAKGKVLNSESRPTLASEGHDFVMKRMGNLIREVVEESGLAFTTV